MPAEQAIRFFRDTSGARIAYATVGEGPLILCPAWWVSHVERDWQHAGFRRFFTRLAEGFRVVRYDRPGTGLSDRDVPPRTQADEVQLLATLADALGDTKFSIFAVSCAGPQLATHQSIVGIVLPIRNLRIACDEQRTVRSRIGRSANRTTMKFKEPGEQRGVPEIIRDHANPQRSTARTSQFIDSGFYQTIPIGGRHVG